ncbi:MAG: peptide ABC transporter substrate-binding protein [Gammaproteobacteria bacterium]
MGATSALKCCAGAALLLILSACGGDPPATDGAGRQSQQRAAEQIIYVGNSAEPQTLDPHRAEGVPSSNIMRDLFEGLTSEAPNGDVIGGAASSWEISDNGLTYTFTLRSEARWSNGDPVTAHDFVYGLRRSLDPATLSNYTFILAPILNADAVSQAELPPQAIGVHAIGELTLEIKLSGPTPYFLGLLNHATSYPVHRPSVEAHGSQHTRPGNLVSNGAYALDQWSVQSHIKLVRNPQYWDNANTVIDEVWYYPIEEQSTELRRYRANELDYTYDIPYKQLDWIRENLPDELLIAPYLGSYYYGFNLTRPPFKDNLPLRRALALAINREILTERVTGAGEIPAYGWVPPVTDYQGQKMLGADWDQQRRNEAAVEYYQQAGYSRENPVELQILYNTHDNHRSIAVAIAAMWKQVLGVETSLVNQEWKVFLDTRLRKVETQVFRAGWIGDYNDAHTFSVLMGSRSGRNDPGYDNPEYDRLLALAAQESDLAARRQILEQAERILLEDLPIIPIYFYVTKRMMKPWVGGFETNIMDHHYHKDMFILEH